jgi:exonuclease SbcC
MIKSVRLKNFKKHGNLEVEFAQGMNVIRGANSAGKSTVLNAIAYALYGTQAVPGTSNTLVKHGEKSMEVAVDFTLGGKNYTIRRGKTSAAVLEDGKIVATGSTPVSEWVIDHFGADVADFLTFSYSRQGETAALLTLGATQLQKKIERLAKVDLIEKVLSALTKRANILEGKISSTVVEDTREDKDRLKEMRKEHKALIEEQMRLQEIVKIQSEVVAEHQAKLGEMQPLADKAAELNAAIKDTEKMLEDHLDLCEHYSDELEDHPESIEGELKIAAETLKDAEAGFKQLVNATEQVNNLKGSLTQIQEWLETDGYPALERYNKLKPELEQLEIRRAEVEKQLETVSADIASVEAKLKSKKRELKSGVCSECKRPFEDFDPDAVSSEIKKLEEKLTELRRQSGSLSSELAGVKKAENTLVDDIHDVYGLNIPEIVQKQQAAHQKLKEKYEKFVESVDGEADIEKAMQKITKLTERVNDLKAKKKRRDEILQALTESEAKAARAKDALSLYRAELDELGDDVPSESDILSVKETINAAQKETDEATKKLWEVTPKLNLLKSQIEAVEKTIEKAEHNKQVLRNLKKSYDMTKELSKFLRNRRSEYLSNVWDTILGRASEIVRQSTSEMDEPIDEILLDEKNRFLFRSGEHVFPVQGGAGGCQTEMLGVAMRLALSDVFYEEDAGFMLLDEASSQMSDENALNLAAMLSATGKQIVYVTHRTTEQLTAENVILLGETQ